MSSRPNRTFGRLSFSSGMIIAPQRYAQAIPKPEADVKPFINILRAVFFGHQTKRHGQAYDDVKRPARLTGLVYRHILKEAAPGFPGI